MNWNARMPRLRIPATLRRSRTPAAPTASTKTSVLAGLITGSVFSLVYFAPASWLAPLVSQASDQRVRLLNAQGRIWAGSAQLVLSSGSVSWRLSPAWMGADLGLSATCCTNPSADDAPPIALSFRQGWGQRQVDIRIRESVWPAVTLQGLGTPWNTIALQGDLAVQADGFSLIWSDGRLTTRGHARLQATGITSPLSTLKPLGSYVLDLTGADTTQIELKTIEGGLQLSGRGQWIGAKLRFNGVAQASPDREAALASLLNLIGQRRGVQSIITIG